MKQYEVSSQRLEYYRCSVPIPFNKSTSALSLVGAERFPKLANIATTMNKNEVTSLRRQSGVSVSGIQDAEFILQTYLYMLAFYCASHTWDISDPFPDRSKDFLAPPILRKLKNQMTTKTLLRTSQTDFHDFSRFNTIKVYNSSPPRSTPILCQHRPEN